MMFPLQITVTDSASSQLVAIGPVTRTSVPGGPWSGRSVMPTASTCSTAAAPLPHPRLSTAPTSTAARRIRAPRSRTAGSRRFVRGRGAGLVAAVQDWDVIGHRTAPPPRRPT
jgi:hypothetical protein